AVDVDADGEVARDLAGERGACGRQRQVVVHLEVEIEHEPSQSTHGIAQVVVDGTEGSTIDLIVDSVEDATQPEHRRGDHLDAVVVHIGGDQGPFVAAGDRRAADGGCA